MPAFGQSDAWDIAVRYHEFKARASMRKILRQLRRISAEVILRRAQAVLGSVVHPHEKLLASWLDLPGDAGQPDIDIDETIDQTPAGLRDVADIVMSYEVRRRQPLVLTVDTSLSMTGEKLALTAVALAVVLLQFPDDPIGIIAFESEAKVLKRPDERISLQTLIERFLDVPAQGYTHLEDGLQAALKQVRRAAVGGQHRLPSAVVLTDGKYTAGRDPAYLASKFPHLIVLKMGEDRASLSLCKELARGGHGALREVGEYNALPGVMYAVVKDLLRGRS